MKYSDFSIGEKITVTGDCTGLIEDGGELSEIELKALHAPGVELYLKGPRPIRGRTYKINGVAHICEASAIRNGNEYVTTYWTFVLNKVH